MAKLKTVAQLEQCAEKISQYGVIDKIDGVSVPDLLVKIASAMQNQFNALEIEFNKNFEQFNKIANLEKTIEKNNREIVGLITKLDSYENQKVKAITYEQSIVDSLDLINIVCNAQVDDNILYVSVSDDYCCFSAEFNVLINERFEIVNQITSMIVEAREVFELKENETRQE